MGLSFQWRPRIAPDIRLNFSKRGLSSISVGRRGAWLDLNRRDTRESAPGTGLRYEAERRPYGARTWWRKLVWAAVVGVTMIVIAGFVAQTSAQTSPTSPAPLIGSQWSPIRETMHDLIKSGYALTAVTGQTTNGDVAANFFYLVRGTDLVRCGEVYGAGQVGTTVFPCERLVAPRPSK
jgi:hypothetical protein